MSVDLMLGDSQLILTYCLKKGILRNQAAYIMATSYWETAHTMQPVEEAYYLQAKYKWTDERMDQWRRENLRYYPHHGRGYTQTTWERNYLKLQLATGVELMNSLELAMRPDIAVVALVDGIMEGWWTGKKLTDYVTLQRSDYVGARRCVNGTDKAGAIAELARDYEAALKLVGYGIEEPDVPVVNENRDGTAPRENKLESTTIQAVIVGAVGTAGQMVDQVKGVVGDLSENLGVSPEVALGILVLGTFLYIYRERISKWSQGIR